jgi:hypothetical protein
MQLLVLVGLTLICALAWGYLRPASGRVEGPTGTPSTLAEFRNHLDRIMGAPDPQWADCPCCGCPTINVAAPLFDCAVCDWLHDPSAAPQPIELARENFALHGTVDPQQYTEEWFGPPPGDREIAARRAIVAASDAARAGTMELPDAWTAIREQLAVMDEEAGKRIDALERRFAEE